MQELKNALPLRPFSTGISCSMATIWAFRGDHCLRCRLAGGFLVDFGVFITDCGGFTPGVIGADATIACSGTTEVSWLFVIGAMPGRFAFKGIVDTVLTHQLGLNNRARPSSRPLAVMIWNNEVAFPLSSERRHS